ncbi:MAG: bifunctional class I SAM-dependent methyltransferase/glycosyltransferase family 2 protein [Anaerolineae bacterium]|nr:bifunctional class I SAM-dependent methyltransferase/glycosyltransferase family 2 protein [Anaerolineae bacterium]
MPNQAPAQISNLHDYNAQRRAHWDTVATGKISQSIFSRAYQARLTEVYSLLVSPGQRVLEIGCGLGDLLAATRPAYGVGIDFSPEIIRQARQRHPQLNFVEAEIHTLKIKETFDVIILSDLVNDLWDVQTALESLRPLCISSTRIILNLHSRLHQPALGLAANLGLANRTLPQNWLTPEDLENLLYLAGFEIIRRQKEVLLPLPLVGGFFNKFLAKLPLFDSLTWSNVLVARPQAEPAQDKPVVSVIIPARNEAGNVEAVFSRLPRMGAETEIVFVEGHSKDDTYETIQKAIAAHPEWRCQLHKQSGKGKADAVRLGYAKTSGDVLMILDADLTVRPEELPRFYEALVSGKGEFINGVRLVYPMQEQAMRFLNLLGNKFFSLAFSWLLGQPLKDTLCGTKVLYRKDYERIAANRTYFGDFDPFGDYDLIFGAAKQNLKIVDLPIRYQERTYGSTNIDRWRHGMLLIRMVAFAAFRLKFI